MALVAVLDANVLFPQSLCDLLIRSSQQGLFQARWTHEILDETVSAIAKRHPEIRPEKLERRRSLMISAVRDCLVDDYEHLIPDLTLPDPDDRHVLAAAIVAGARLIVTANLRDFPAAALARHRLQACSPDAFVTGLARSSSDHVARIVHQMAADTRRPALSVTDVLESLRRSGLPCAAAEIRMVLSGSTRASGPATHT